MPTLATCSKSALLGLMLAWANLSFAHALGHGRHPTADGVHDDAPAGTHHAVDERVEDLSVRGLIQRYSQTGNDHLLERGWKLLEPDLEQPTPQVWIEAAWLAQAEHRFELSREYVQKVLNVQPRHAQAWLLEASVASVQGDFAAARTACRKVSLSVAPIVSLACQLKVEQNPARQALLLKQVKRLSPGSLDASTRAWVWSAIGDAHFSRRDLHQALDAYQQSHQHSPSVQSLAVLADVHRALDRSAEMIDRLRALRTVPAIGVRYVLAVRESGNALARRFVEQEIRRMDAQFASWIDANDFRHAREMVMFYLDVLPQPELAHRLAVENIGLQREPEDKALLDRALEQSAATTGQ